MDKSKVIARRLHNQHLNRNSFQKPGELVSWMGALQAQDYRMVKWAMGIRLAGSNKTTIEKAITEGTIIRTHLLRPTWHFVAAKDLRWILKLTAPRIKVAMRSRHKHLGLTDELIDKSNAVIADAIAGNIACTRNKLVAALEEEGFENKDNLASHLLLRAEIDGVICSGPTKGKSYTYALLDDRISKTDTLSKDEALARLARTYFRSHSPARLTDFVWWSGLTKTSARKALNMIRDDFDMVDLKGQTYWFDNAQKLSPATESAHLLPAFDEFLISYKNRSRIIPDDEQRKKAISNNGIFRPVIVVNGEVVGIWNRSLKKKVVSIELDFFEKPTKRTSNMVEVAAKKFASFHGKEPEISMA